MWGSPGEIRRREPIHLSQAVLQHCRGGPDHPMPHLPPTTASRMSLIPLRVTQAGGEAHPNSQPASTQASYWGCSRPVSCWGQWARQSRFSPQAPTEPCTPGLVGPPGKPQLVCWVTWPGYPTSLNTSLLFYKTESGPSQVCDANTRQAPGIWWVTRNACHCLKLKCSQVRESKAQGVGGCGPMKPGDPADSVPSSLRRSP